MCTCTNMYTCTSVLKGSVDTISSTSKQRKGRKKQYIHVCVYMYVSVTVLLQGLNFYTCMYSVCMTLTAVLVLVLTNLRRATHTLSKKHQRVNHTSPTCESLVTRLVTRTNDYMYTLLLSCTVHVCMYKEQHKKGIEYT